MRLFHTRNAKDVSFFWGPLLTVLCTILYHLGGKALGYTLIPAGSLIFVVLGSFVGGWPAGLVSALWGTAYAIFLTDDPTWIFQIGLVSFVIVWVVTWQKGEIIKQENRADVNQAKADWVDSANGNINRLRTILKIIDDLLAGWHVLSEEGRRGVIGDIRNQLATMTLLVVGWRALAKERQLVSQNYEKEG